MRKKFFTVMIATVIAMFTGYNIYLSQSTESTMSYLALANVEALADSNESGRCDNHNGYRRIQDGDERIYDCCYVEKTGRGKTDCKRW